MVLLGNKFLRSHKYKQLNKTELFILKDEMQIL